MPSFPSPFWSFAVRFRRFKSSIPVCERFSISILIHFRSWAKWSIVSSPRRGFVILVHLWKFFLVSSTSCILINFERLTLPLPVLAHHRWGPGVQMVILGPSTFAMPLPFTIIDHPTWIEGMGFAQLHDTQNHSRLTTRTELGPYGSFEAG